MRLSTASERSVDSGHNRLQRSPLLFGLMASDLTDIDCECNHPYVYANVICRNIWEMFTAHNKKT